MIDNSPKQKTETNGSNKAENGKIDHNRDLPIQR